MEATGGEGPREAAASAGLLKSGRMGTAGFAEELAITEACLEGRYSVRAGDTWQRKNGDAVNHVSPKRTRAK